MGETLFMTIETAIFFALIILGFVLSKIPYVRAPFDWMETFFHELSHGLAATLTFGWMRRMKLNIDGSGYCVTTGGMRIPTLLAGYCGAVIFGVIIYLIGWHIGHGAYTTLDQIAVLRFLLGLFAFITLIAVRDITTLFIMAFMAAALALPIYYANILQKFPWYLEFVGLYILKGALFAPLHLIDGQHVGDGADLADRTFIPEIVWVIFWLIFASLGVYFLYLVNIHMSMHTAWYIIKQTIYMPFR